MFSINLPTSIPGEAFVVGGRRLRAGTSRFLGPCSFISFKVFVSIYCLFWCIWWPARDNIRVYLYLNFWTFYMTTAYFILSAISATLCAIALEKERLKTPETVPEPPEGEQPPKKHRKRMILPTSLTSRKGPPVPWQIRFLQHFAWNVACVSSLVVLTVFWVGIYDGSELTTVDYNAHAIIPGALVLDQLLIATEYKCRSFWITEYYGIVYLFFNLGWYYEKSKGERVLYEVMNWEINPGRATLYTFVIFCGLVPAFSVFHSTVCIVREWVFKNCVQPLEVAPEEPAPAPAPPAEPEPAPAPAAEPDKAKEAAPDEKV